MKYIWRSTLKYFQQKVFCWPNSMYQNVSFSFIKKVIIIHMTLTETDQLLRWPNQYSSQSDFVKAYIRVCHSSVWKPTIVSHFTQRTSQSLNYTLQVPGPPSLHLLPSLSLLFFSQSSIWVTVTFSVGFSHHRALAFAALMAWKTLLLDNNIVQSLISVRCLLRSHLG